MSSAAKANGSLTLQVFEGEGYPTPTDLRYCINSVCLTLTPAENEKAEEE